MSGNASVAPAEVVERIDRVTDPELDRSIVDLDYVEDVAVDPPTATIELTLPTAWCSPAFAWMMAADARDAAGDLSGIDRVRVRLRDHMHGEEISRGVSRRQAFEDVFDDAEDDLSAVRAQFDHKARVARQYDAVEALDDAGVDPSQSARLRRRDVDIDALDGRTVVRVPNVDLYVTVPTEPIERYVRKAEAVGLVAAPDDRLFATLDGDPVPPEEAETVHRRARLTRTNMRGQGGICARLHEARNGDRPDA